MLIPAVAYSVDVNGVCATAWRSERVEDRRSRTSSTARNGLVTQRASTRARRSPVDYASKDTETPSCAKLINTCALAQHGSTYSEGFVQATRKRSGLCQRRLPPASSRRTVRPEENRVPRRQARGEASAASSESVRALITVLVMLCGRQGIWALKR